MILKQKQADQRREFELAGEILKLKYATWGEVKEWTVNLENVGENIVYQSATRKRMVIVSIFLSIFLLFLTISLFMSDDFNGNLPIVIVAYVICGGVMALGWFLPLKKEIHLVGGSVNITFYQNSPSKDETDHFVNEVVRRSKKLLVDKYGKVDPDLPEDTMMGQFFWLKNRNLISEETYENLKQDYKRKRMINRIL